MNRENAISYFQMNFNLEKINSKTYMKCTYYTDYMDICFVTDLSIFVNMVLYMIYNITVLSIFFYSIFQFFRSTSEETENW